MYNFLATLTELNQSYVEQLKFFGISAPALTHKIQEKTEGIVSGKSERQLSQNTQITPIFDFPRIPSHTARVHGIEEDDVRYADFSHHIRMQEEEYRKYAGHEFDIHINEITKNYQQSLYIITHIFPRYLKRYWRFLDRYLTLLEQPEFNINQKNHISQSGNIFQPWSISSQKKDYDSLLQSITSMEEAWEKEKLIIIHGLQNTYQACLKNEQYWSIVGYFTPEETLHAEKAKEILQKISDDKVAILNLIGSIDRLTLSAYRNGTSEFRINEHIKVKENMKQKKSPTK